MIGSAWPSTEQPSTFIASETSVRRPDLVIASVPVYRPAGAPWRIRPFNTTGQTSPGPAWRRAGGTSTHGGNSTAAEATRATLSVQYATSPGFSKTRMRPVAERSRGTEMLKPLPGRSGTTARGMTMSMPPAPVTLRVVTRSALRGTQSASKPRPAGGEKTIAPARCSTAIGATEHRVRRMAPTTNWRLYRTRSRSTCLTYRIIALRPARGTIATAASWQFTRSTRLLVPPAVT